MLPIRYLLYFIFPFSLSFSFCRHFFMIYALPSYPPSFREHSLSSRLGIGTLRRRATARRGKGKRGCPVQRSGCIPCVRSPISQLLPSPPSPSSPCPPLSLMPLMPSPNPNSRISRYRYYLPPSLPTYPFCICLVRLFSPPPRLFPAPFNPAFDPSTRRPHFSAASPLPRREIPVSASLPLSIAMIVFSILLVPSPLLLSLSTSYYYEPPPLLSLPSHSVPLVIFHPASSSVS
ncbi:hypothetical protein C8Q73DRAFT_309501 [Cubamyces lactineus]|nr:hypothetical protein C8Q73DRAFT_309501 [Cubamyces lactineus]